MSRALCAAALCTMTALLAGCGSSHPPARHVHLSITEWSGSGQMVPLQTTRAT